MYAFFVRSLRALIARAQRDEGLPRSALEVASVQNAQRGLRVQGTARQEDIHRGIRGNFIQGCERAALLDDDGLHLESKPTRE